jgi:hypothetical protein
MASRAFLIRFIDIGLIVLFGFLMISDIESSSRVELASEGDQLEEEQPEPEEARGFVRVEILPAGGYAVSDPQAVDVAPVRAADVDALAEELGRRRGLHEDLGIETVVLIQPDPASLVQGTVDAMDVCDRLGLAKSLRMDIEIAPPPDSTSAGAGGDEEGR